MTLTCPHCGFARDTDPARIPPGATEATCPRCRQSFPFERETATAPSAPAAPSPELLPKGGFWQRVAAALVDSAAVTVVQFAGVFLLGFILQATAGGVDAVELMAGLLSTALAIAYYVFFTGYCGQTPGKMLLGLKVIRTDGRDIGYGRAFAREVPAKFLSGILLGIGYLMVAFDRRKQGLHDKIADTYVIKI